MYSQILAYLTPIGIITATIVLAYIANRLLSRLIRRAREDLHNDPTNYKFLGHLPIALIYLVGFGLAIYTIPPFRTLAKSLLAGAGIAAVAIGFASQHALSNIISGIFVVLFKPFRINDRLALQTFQGVVEDITLRHTVIRDFENKRIIIPNSVISDQIIENSDFADEKVCRCVDVGISYSSDIDLAKRIIAEEIETHPLNLDPRTPENIADGMPRVVVHVLALQDSAVLIRGWAWAINSADAFVMFCDVIESVKKRFDREGVVIPFPQRSVTIMNGREEQSSDSFTS